MRIFVLYYFYLIKKTTTKKKQTNENIILNFSCCCCSCNETSSWQQTIEFQKIIPQRALSDLFWKYEERLTGLFLLVLQRSKRVQEGWAGSQLFIWRLGGLLIWLVVCLFAWMNVWLKERLNEWMNEWFWLMIATHFFFLQSLL